MGIVWILTGLLMLFLSSRQKHKIKEHESYTGRAVATIVDIKKRTFENSRDYRPVLEFYSNGNRYVMKSPTHSQGRCNYVVGDTVNVIFREDDLTKFMLEGDRAWHNVALMFKIFGIPLIATVVFITITEIIAGF